MTDFTLIRSNPALTMWCVILGAAAGYEYAMILRGLSSDVETGQMLSHLYARSAKHHPVVTHGLLALTVLHLLDGSFPGLLPERCDMYRGFGIIHPATLIRRNR